MENIYQKWADNTIQKYGVTVLDLLEGMYFHGVHSYTKYLVPMLHFHNYSCLCINEIKISQV